MQNEGTAPLQEFIRRVTQHMQIPCDIAVTAENAGALRVSIQAPDEGRLLIGKNGQNLRALEHIARIMWMRQHPEHGAVVVDVNNYRAQQSERLVSAIHEAAVRVQQTRRSEAMPPMTSYERRVVHTELAVYSDLATESVGQDPHRRVVIKPL